MAIYIARRLAQGVLVLWLTTMLVFCLVRVTGDPSLALLSADADKEQLAAFRKEFGLDEPLPVQYWHWTERLIHGDLGDSFKNRRPVVGLIAERLANTVQLAAVAFVLAAGMGLSLGIVAAMRRDTWVDVAAKGLAFLGMSIPNFALGIVLILLFSVQLRWLPTSGMGSAANFVMPAITLAFGLTAAGILRITRSSILDVLDAEYVTTARAKGLSEGRIALRHVLKNALLPVITFAGFSFSLFISGSVIVESIFRWPGIGLLSVDAVLFRDYPVLQGVLLVVTTWVILVNLMVDIAYAYVDPRIRY